MTSRYYFFLSATVWYFLSIQWPFLAAFVLFIQLPLPGAIAILMYSLLMPCRPAAPGSGRDGLKCFTGKLPRRWKMLAGGPAKKNIGNGDEGKTKLEVQRSRVAGGIHSINTV